MQVHLCALYLPSYRFSIRDDLVKVNRSVCSPLFFLIRQTMKDICVCARIYFCKKLWVVVVLFLGADSILVCINNLIDDCVYFFRPSFISLLFSRCWCGVGSRGLFINQRFLLREFFKVIDIQNGYTGHDGRE